MGPHSFKCGKRRIHHQERQRDTALQWGRTLSSAESYIFVRSHVYLILASMGPHSFKCGKRGCPRQNKQINRASMGPHSFKCGKRRLGFVAVLAQIGFNGAALFQVRKVIDLESAKKSPARLQWGRTLSSAERAESKANWQDRSYASMGPHSFKCGKRFARQVESGKKRLQWGRTLSSAESS